jgi:hypothetical protein
MIEGKSDAKRRQVKSKKPESLTALLKQLPKRTALRGPNHALNRKSGVVVHNSVYPVDGFGSRGSRSWLQEPDRDIEKCDCGWFPQLGSHYRHKGLTKTQKALAKKEQRGWEMPRGWDR